MGRMAIYYDAVQIKDNALQHGESPTTPEPPTRARSLARIGSWPAFLYPPDSRKWGRLPSFRRVWVKGQRRYRRECGPGGHKKKVGVRPENLRKGKSSEGLSAFSQKTLTIPPGAQCHI